MADNIFSNDSLPPLNLSSNFSISEDATCSFYTLVYNIVHISLLLPLCLLVFYHGIRRWQQKRSSSLTSHSDWFTYHAAIMELLGVVSCFLDCFTVYEMDIMITTAIILHNLNWAGQTFFHMLTCVERYLAVVHPVTYLSLKNERGIRIRNISIGCVWLLCVVVVGVATTRLGFLIGSFGLLILALTTVSFCSISVLCVLIGPGPGEQAGERKRADQSKQRAFYTIMVILGLLVLRFSFALIQVTLFVSNVSNDCKLKMCELWLNIPSIMVLPCLFLQRAGKLECFKRNQ